MKPTVSLSFAVINLLHCINSVKCSYPERLLVPSTCHVFGSSRFRLGHADIIPLSCFTRDDIYVETQLWKYGGELKLHNPLSHKHHGEHEVSSECMYVHLYASLVVLHFPFADLSSLPSDPEKGAFSKALLSSRLQHRSRHKSNCESNFLNVLWPLSICFPKTVRELAE